MNNSMDIKIDVSGDMNVPNQNPKPQIGFTQLNKIPGAMDLFKLAAKNIKPKPEFFNFNNFRTAASMPRLSSRFVRNIKYFNSNYLCIFVFLMIYCLITSPLLLLVLISVALICYKVQRVQTQITVFGHELKASHQTFAVLIASVPVLFLVGAGAALFWTLGASCFLTSLHAAFYNIDAIVTEENEIFLSEVV